jgi:hypothetical protein
MCGGLVRTREPHILKDFERGTLRSARISPGTWPGRRNPRHIAYGAARPGPVVRARQPRRRIDPHSVVRHGPRCIRRLSYVLCNIQCLHKVYFVHLQPMPLRIAAVDSHYLRLTSACRDNLCGVTSAQRTMRALSRKVARPGT